MNKKTIMALIVSIVIFVVIILGINIWLKRYAAESTVVTPQIPAQITERRLITNMPVEQKKESEPEEEEPEREAPIGSKEPLLN